MCNGKLEEKNVEHHKKEVICFHTFLGYQKPAVFQYKEFGISLGKFKAKVCTKCGELFYDSETATKIQTKSKELGLFGLAKMLKFSSKNLAHEN